MGAGTWQELVTLLAEPADNLSDGPEPPAQGSDPVSSVMTALKGLHQQCEIYKRSAAELGKPQVDLLCQKIANMWVPITLVMNAASLFRRVLAAKHCCQTGSF